MDAVEIKTDKEQNDLYRDRLVFLSLDVILIAILLTEFIVEMQPNCPLVSKHISHFQTTDFADV